MKKLSFLLLLTLPLAFGFTTLPTSVEGSACGTPTNVHKTGNATTSVTYTWDEREGEDSYKVKYVRQSDGYQSPVWVTMANSYTFTGLNAGAYKFYFASVCGEDMSEFIVIDDINGN